MLSSHSRLPSPSPPIKFYWNTKPHPLVHTLSMATFALAELSACNIDSYEALSFLGTLFRALQISGCSYNPTAVLGFLGLSFTSCPAPMPRAPLQTPDSVLCLQFQGLQDPDTANNAPMTRSTFIWPPWPPPPTALPLLPSGPRATGAVTEDQGRPEKDDDLEDLPPQRP